MVSGTGIGATVVVTAVVSGLIDVVDVSIGLVVVEISNVVDGELLGVLTEQALNVTAQTPMRAPNRAMDQF